MANQYFENSEDLEHELKTFDFTLKGHNLKFTSDSGVFSRQTIYFGSRVLIEAIDFSNVPQGDILDVGCGYGPIGLALAKDQTSRQVTMTDVNLRALDLAKKNASANKIENVNIFESSIYDKIEDKYALIVSNPPIRAGKEVVSGIIAEAADHLLPSGEVWIVIQKKQGAPSAKKLMKLTYGNVDVVTRDKGYYILRSKLQ
ncbi:class I SAM-dependent methyltransferase [Companilactobacillus sp.]|uniref:class I SAM-dependent methyltransferase n=1 Tax=Companilactobacillus sp. TaxID=2767905 RepID=UPI0025C22138|nr:class I SAM-dependent methyltransferase [Companilactobacillus sp.]MCH4010249.1 class I SAM-dependent methyltransferase [Companilactobacillus sp.]MCH4052075.1 class I SAM-dependent methyltransferase [Companilactobacillus sp.]MCH4078191.1 class I SAM-dependent methyltransferase [Companilactobacillus sp.]MCH4126767.1 class I SAM-dependent methyltransferase [Companilactobacillus sp.]MCH4132352.1 class I SAM-dependent methyltransferase [Companilactobacillus sp.]